MTSAARLIWVEIRGFRSFGAEPRRISLNGELIVVHAGNSQGKTSLAEALEFLISGHCSRRELLGGAKAEYHGSLRNVHLASNDRDVYVSAMLRGLDGAPHEVRRELTHDFETGTECRSRLLIDGMPSDDLSELGIPLSDPPVRAPVLLQHTLRHVLSTEPKQRVGYFKALLSLTDLDLLQARVAAARSTLQKGDRGEALTAVDTLSRTPAKATAKALNDLADAALSREQIAASVDAALQDAGALLLGERPPTRERLLDALDQSVALRREAAFPLAAFSSRPITARTPALPDLGGYISALAQSDRHAARLVPIISAVLSVRDFTELGRPVDCPVCATPDALTPARMKALRTQLRRTEAVDAAAADAKRVLEAARHSLGQLGAALQAIVPAASRWDSEQMQAASRQLRELNVDAALLANARSTAGEISTEAGHAASAIQGATTTVDQAQRAVTRREELLEALGSSWSVLESGFQRLMRACKQHQVAADALRTAVGSTVQDRLAGSGFDELLYLVRHADQLVTDLEKEAGRRRAISRLTKAEQALRAASGRVLDTRFSQMSDAVATWWASIRPEELVGFGGVRRRAAGAMFINLVAALRASHAGEAIERDALGVYSDSQLNALGLSIFLARAQLLGAPVVVLDDPIPGSDSDHRLTFVQNTLGGLLDSGTQVILTTFDSKLADWAQSNHGHRDLISYELTLLDPAAGTDITQTSDPFSRLLLEAEDNLNAPTPRGRRAACGSYRAAAERLAKQIIATGRSDEGQPCTVADVHNEATTLGDLVPLVSCFALGNDERGQWKTFAKVLNPGNHDDDVPSTTELKQIRGNLRKIAKNHHSRWPGGLTK